MLFTKNFKSICRYASIRKGILITTIKMDTSMAVFKFTRREMPVTPPSINLLGSKKPRKPNPADSTPNDMNKNDTNDCLSAILNLK